MSTSAATARPKGRIATAGWTGVAVTALVSALLSIIGSISFPAIVFVGEAAPLYGQGVGAALVGSVIVGVTVGLFSSFRGSLANAQVEPLVVVAIMVQDIVQRLHEDDLHAQIPATVLAAVAVSVLTIAVGLLLLGLLRAGDLVRYLPFPIIGGFLAGIGWLLLASAVTAAMTGTDIDPMRALTPGQMLHWLPGCAAGALLFAVQRWRPGPMNLPAAMLVAGVLFWIVAWATGHDAALLHEEGWLLGPFPSDDLLQVPPYLTMLDDVAWYALVPELPKLGTVLLVTALSVLLTATSLEMAAQSDIDLNRELRVHGVANGLTAVAGGFPGFTSISGSMLAMRLGGSRRIAMVAAALLCGVALLAGPDILGLIPRLLVSLILFYLGLEFLEEWLVRTRRRMPSWDWYVLVLVFAATVALDFMTAVGLGLAAGLLLLAIRYSRTGPVRLTLDGTTAASQVERAGPQQAVLQAAAGSVHVLGLQGYLFFGTAHQLVQAIAGRLADRERPRLRFLMLDFERLLGLDATALESLARINQLAERNDFEILIGDPSPDTVEVLRRAGLGGPETPRMRLHRNRDAAMEWIETWILEGAMPLRRQHHVLEAMLKVVADDPGDQALLAAGIRRETVEAGTVLLEQGAEADGILLILDGRVDVQVKAGGEFTRVSSFEGGTVVGEIAFYTGEHRSASVVAVTRAEVGRVDAADLRRLEAERPDLAAAFHRAMARLLAQRLAGTLRLVMALER